MIGVLCVRALQETHDRVVAERDELTSSLTCLRGTVTPRPEWSRCEGYVEDWEESSRGLSSNQLLDLLLTKISGSPVATEERDQSTAVQDSRSVITVLLVGDELYSLLFPPAQSRHYYHGPPPPHVP